MNTKLGTNTVKISRIQELLGYRPSYLLIDRVTVTDDTEFTAIKNVSINEPYFSGHFPDNPVMPGVAQLEAMFQLAVICFRKQRSQRSLIPFLHELRKVKFRNPVIPGDRLEISSRLVSLNDNQIVAKMTSQVGEKISSEAELVIRFYKNSQEIPLSEKVRFPIGYPKMDGVPFNVIDIQKLIPHRFPFVFIDRILYNHTEGGKNTVIGLKNVTFNEPYSLSFIDDFVFLPSSFQIEMIAQTGCVYTLSQPQHRGKSIYFTSIDQASFYRPVIPGDQLFVRATTLIVKEKYGRGEGATFINDELVSEAKIKFAIIERE